MNRPRVSITITQQPLTEEVLKAWRKLSNMELYNLYSSKNIIMRSPTTTFEASPSLITASLPSSL
jgi:predicted AlkP superfamily pyrophosphatase or phosphodiesterase